MLPFSTSVAVASLVDRATGTMRSFTFDKFRADEVDSIVRAKSPVRPG